MRHRITKKKMGRPTGHRIALARNLASSLVLSEKVETTLEKAKFVKPFVEKVITKAKKGVSSGDKIKIYNTVKELKQLLANDSAIKKLLDDLAIRFEKRNGGYTRIIKTGNRAGDNANTARIELLPAEKTVKPAEKQTDKEKKTPVESTAEKKKTKAAKTQKKELKEKKNEKK